MDSRTKVLAAGAAGLAAGLVLERLRRKPKDVTGRHDARVIVVLGAQWGDEGKGKLVDVLAGRASLPQPLPVESGARLQAKVPRLCHGPPAQRGCVRELPRRERAPSTARGPWPERTPTWT